MNKIIKNQSGVSLVAVVIITGVALVGGYLGYYLVMDKPEDGAEIMEENMMGDADGSGQMMKDDESMTEEGGGMMVDYKGKVLAGTSAKLLDFDKSDFDMALKSDKLIVLYFYANWCPLCRAEFPKMEQAFNELTSDNVIGFRVSYNDNETDKDEENLAREHGVAYQHTKVFVRNGERIGKWPDSWDKDRYLSEINNKLQ